MLDTLQGFVHELREAGLPLSMTENLDAMRAVEHVDIADRDTFKAALGATLVKHYRHEKVFDTVFDVYFSLYAPGIGDPGDLEAAQEFGDESAAAPSGSGGAGELSPEELAEMLLSALATMDREELRRLAAMAVQRFAGMEPGRPVGGTYY
ncbi:MAG: vWA domain-containing protein, partial [Acidimicrobiia bacterium]